VNRITQEWRTQVPATLEAIEQFCSEFQLWRALACAELDPFSAELLLREALTNAVIHGVAQDPRKRVSCLLRARRGRLLIAVKDEGEGFDWRAARDRLPDTSDTCGRGMEVFRRYANCVRFSSKGNSVILVKRY
jgi:serine/threonine-protein kinase RsbW